MNNINGHVRDQVGRMIKQILGHIMGIDLPVSVWWHRGERQAWEQGIIDIHESICDGLMDALLVRT